MPPKQISDFSAVVTAAVADLLLTKQDADGAARKLTITQLLDLLATVSQAEAEAGTATTRRAWTAERVKQAIAAHTSAWVDKTASRALGTIYQNTSGRDILIAVTVQGAVSGMVSMLLYVGASSPPDKLVGGVTVSVNAVSQHRGDLSVAVPTSHYYRVVDNLATGILESWCESPAGS